MICGGPGVSDAYYCKECTLLEKDVSFWFSVSIDIFNQNNSNSCRITIYREMVVRKSSIWVVQKPICSTNEKNMDSSRSDEPVDISRRI